MSKKKEDEILEDLESAPEPIYGEDLGTKTVSKLLVEARQSLNLSQKEIADQLYLTKTLIQQLEEGEFGDRSTKAFVKGYLRSYARVVGLSADDLIQRFEEEQKEKTSVLEPTLPLAKNSDLASLSITGPVAKTAVLGISALVLIVVLVWAAVQGPGKSEEVKPSSMIATKGQESEEIGETSQSALEEYRKLSSDELNFDVQKNQGPVEEKAETEKTDISYSEIKDLKAEATELEKISEEETDRAPGEGPELTEVKDALAEEESGISEVNEVAIKISELVDFQRIVSGDKSSIFVTTDGGDELKMIFRDECWTEVDEDGLGRIYNDLNVAGDELTIKGQSPFKVLLGKARSVDITYNGKVVDLEPYIAQDQTAKIRFTD